MGHLIHTANPVGYILLLDTRLECPGCGHVYDEDFYFRWLQNSDGIIYKKCVQCHEKIGISVDTKGNLKTWLKKFEEELGPVE